MMNLSAVRSYIAGLGISTDAHTYIGKLANKKEESIGVYQRGRAGEANPSLGGFGMTSYEVKAVSLLVHWTHDKTESENAAFSLYEALTEKPEAIGNSNVQYLKLLQNEPVDVGTDANGVYEYVIEFDLYYAKQEDN